MMMIACGLVDFSVRSPKDMRIKRGEAFVSLRGAHLCNVRLFRPGISIPRKSERS